MSRILVVEDDAAVRSLVRMHLEANGYDVLEARDGEVAMHLAMNQRFDLVLSETRLQVMDGFNLLTTLRANPATQSVPFVFLSVDDGRETFRTAMRLGADDFLVKPVDHDELLASIESRLARARSLRENGGQTVLGATVRVKAVDGPAPHAGDAMPTQPQAAVVDTAGAERRELSRETRTGTVLHVTVRNGLAMARGFGAAERKTILQSFFTALCEPVLAQHGWVVRHNARELVAAFETPEGSAPDHAVRALRAGLLSVLGVHQFRQDLQARVRGATLLDFSVGLAVDSGTYDVVTREGEYGRETVLEGALPDALGRVDESVAASGWSVAATELTMRSAGDGFAMGRAAALATGHGVMPLMLVEVVGFAPALAEQSGFKPVYEAVSNAIRANSALADAPPADHFAGVGAPNLTAPSAPLAPELAGVKGYKVLRKLTPGGMSKVYLALHEESGIEHVLKVVPFDEDDDDLLQRFIQEYALIAQVRHPNVARIFGQGFAEMCAYIAMEFLAGGDLRARIDAGIAYQDAMRYLAQTALALTAIHERGIVHRDLKPENLMLRADGTLVLADFGIAKQLSTALTRTRHGEVYGTPFYMSPEQARGDPLDGRSDLYALGIILHEMLTGAKPFTATRAEALVYQHLHSDIPTLPGKFWRVQPILDRLLAKDPRDRYTSAAALLAAVREAGEPTAGGRVTAGG